MLSNDMTMCRRSLVGYVHELLALWNIEEVEINTQLPAPPAPPDDWHHVRQMHANTERVKFDQINSRRPDWPLLNPTTMPAVGAEMAAQVAMVKQNLGGKYSFERAPFLANLGELTPLTTDSNQRKSFLEEVDKLLGPTGVVVSTNN